MWFQKIVFTRHITIATDNIKENKEIEGRRTLFFKEQQLLNHFIL